MTGQNAGTSTTTTSPPPEMLAAFNRLEGAGTNLTQSPIPTYSGPLIAGFTPSQQQAFGTIDSSQGIGLPFLNSAAQEFGQATTPLWSNLPQFSGNQISKYESPYTQNVTDALTNLFNEQNQQQQQQIAGNAVARGAYGGDREAVAQSLAAREQALAQAPTLANVRQAGYAQALDEFNKQQATQLSADQANRWLANQAGIGLAGLGKEAQNEALTGASAQLQSGGLQQQLAQEMLNIPYQQWAQSVASPYQQLNFLGGLTTGLGSLSGGSSSTTTPGPSTLSQVAGLGLGGLGLIGATGGFGDGGWFTKMFRDGGRIGYDGGGGIGDDLPDVPDVGVGLLPEPLKAPAGSHGPNLNAISQTQHGGGGGGIGDIVGPLMTVAKIAAMFAEGGRAGRPGEDMPQIGSTGGIGLPNAPERIGAIGTGLPKPPSQSFDALIKPGPMVKGAGAPPPPRAADTGKNNAMPDLGALGGIFKNHSGIGGDYGSGDYGGGDNYDGGDMATGGTPPAPSDQQSMYAKYAQMTTEQLQELAAQYPVETPQGALIHRALQAKKMAPQSTDPGIGPQNAGLQAPGIGAAAAQLQQAQGEQLRPSTGGTSHMAAGGGLRDYVTEDEMDESPIVDHSGETVVIRYPSEGGKAIDLGLPSIPEIRDGHAEFAGGGRARRAGGGNIDPNWTTSSYIGNFQAPNGVYIPQLATSNTTGGSIFSQKPNAQPGGGIGNWFVPLANYEPPGSGFDSTGRFNYPTRMIARSPFDFGAPATAAPAAGAGADAPAPVYEMPFMENGGSKAGGRIGYADGGDIEDVGVSGAGPGTLDVLARHKDPDFPTDDDRASLPYWAIPEQPRISLAPTTPYEDRTGLVKGLTIDGLGRPAGWPSDRAPVAPEGDTGAIIRQHEALDRPEATANAVVNPADVKKAPILPPAAREQAEADAAWLAPVKTRPEWASYDKGAPSYDAPEAYKRTGLDRPIQDILMDPETWKAPTGYNPMADVKPTISGATNFVPRPAAEAAQPAQSAPSGNVVSPTVLGRPQYAEAPVLGGDVGGIGPELPEEAGIGAAPSAPTPPASAAPTAAPTPANTQRPAFFGDSIAAGIRDAAGGDGPATVGWNPAKVLGSFSGADLRGRPVYISSGMSNSGNPAQDIKLVPEQIAAAKSAGANQVYLYGVGTGIRNYQGINQELEQIAKTSGAQFVPLPGTEGGRVHPLSYPDVWTKTGNGYSGAGGGPRNYGPVASAITQEAARQGISDNLALKTAQIESGMGANLGSRGNVFQLGQPEWQSIGGGDMRDLPTQVRNGVAWVKKSQDEARAALGREPQDWETYIVHQQGAAGGPALLRAPQGASAIDVLTPAYGGNRAAAEQAIIQNGGDLRMTAQQFMQNTRARFEGFGQHLNLGAQFGSTSGGIGAGAQGGIGTDQRASAGTTDARIGDLARRVDQTAPRGPDGHKDWTQSPWFPVLAAGLGMLASRSPYPGVAIGEGGLQGVRTALATSAQALKERALTNEAEHRNATLGLEHARLNETERYHTGEIAQRDRAAALAESNLQRQIAAETDRHEQAMRAAQTAETRAAETARHNEATEKLHADANFATATKPYAAMRTNPETGQPEEGTMRYSPEKRDWTFMPGATMGRAPKLTGQNQILNDLVKSGAAPDTASAIKLVADMKRDPTKHAETFARLVQNEALRLQNDIMGGGMQMSDQDRLAKAKENVIANLKSGATENPLTTAPATAPTTPAAPAAARPAVPVPAPAPAAPAAPAPTVSEHPDVTQNGWVYSWRGEAYVPVARAN